MASHVAAELDAIRAVGGGYKPRLVFTSSIAVFGAPFPEAIGDGQAETGERTVEPVVVPLEREHLVVLDLAGLEDGVTDGHGMVERPDGRLIADQHLRRPNPLDGRGPIPAEQQLAG